MPHFTKEELLRASEAGRAEIARMAAHLSACPACRSLAAGVLGDRTVNAKRAPLLKIMVELARLEKAMAAERLLAKAELAELQRLTPGARKERVILSRFCHSPAFLDALLAALRVPRSRKESESLATLALLAAQGMDPAEGSEAFKNDLLAMIWIETANARRIRGEWQSARTALLRAEEHGGAGTGDQSIKARRLSIVGSLQCDQGRRVEAMTSLEECRNAYSLCGEWPQVGRALVQMAHCIADDEPERALDLLNRANIYISPEDAGLRSLMERIRTDCLVTVGRVEDALRAFAEAERMRPLQDRPSAALRSTFMAARLLEALGHMQEAEALFDEVVTGDLEQGFYKDALLDLLYVFGFHCRLGLPDRGAEASLRTLGEMDRRGSVVHEQLRALWSLVRREPRKKQQIRVAESPECHSTAFVELLLARVRQAPSREEAELTASLALQAIAPMEAPSLLKQDLRAQLWTEVANSRRVASEWSKSNAALVQARKHLVGHEQLRTVWMELMDAAGRRAITFQSLAEVRRFLEIHWKKPAAQLPRFSFGLR
jgi:tetratricopeptide (TPR) repeat protein